MNRHTPPSTTIAPIPIRRASELLIPPPLELVLVPWTTVGVNAAVLVAGETGTPGENGLVPSGSAGVTGVEAAVEVAAPFAVVAASDAAGEVISKAITASCNAAALRVNTRIGSPL